MGSHAHLCLPVIALLILRQRKVDREHAPVSFYLGLDALNPISVGQTPLGPLLFHLCYLPCDQWSSHSWPLLTASSRSKMTHPLWLTCPESLGLTFPFKGPKPVFIHDGA